MSVKIVDALLERYASTDAEVALQNDNERHARAMPMQRLLGGGMEYADAIALHSLGKLDLRWIDAACCLGERHLMVAREAEANGLLDTARSEYYYASACFRFGHSAIFSDNDEKRQVHGRMTSSFAEAARLDSLNIEKMTFPHQQGCLCGWLVRPETAHRSPLVICLGGFDGWREEYFAGAQYLAQRGVATLLLDGPGQGETRLIHHLYLATDFPVVISSIIDHLLGQTRFTSIGIWGNSMGGFLAAACAISDRRIRACCVNGGTTHPSEILDRYPRFIGKIQATLGIAEPETAAAKMKQFSIVGHEQKLTCPLLQLHGQPDKVFLLENARRIYDGAACKDKTLIVWQDGDHCIYNHTHEKYCELADWFAVKLKAPSDGSE